MNPRERLCELYPDSGLIFADGYDDAIVGVDCTNWRVVYDTSKILDKLKSDGMDELEAVEFFEYNIAGSYLGSQTPIYLTPIALLEEVP